MNYWLAVPPREGGVLEALDSALAEQCLFETMSGSCSCTYCLQADKEVISFVVEVVIVLLCVNVIVLGQRHWVETTTVRCSCMY